MTAIEIPTPDPRALDDTGRAFAEALSERYAIKREIGRGGMGIVFLARDRRLERLVAIKTLPPHLSTDPALRERFLRETRTAGAMSHPNIVPIHGADDVDGHVYFVMSFIDGESLAARIKGQGRLDAATVGRYLRDVASALAHAHRRGIIHRDIKAENILVERATDHAMVTDFGIARLADATPLTATGQVLGTVYYVSPEQVSGETVDARGDIYSLGVVGFFALTGRFPFDADVASAVLVAHVTKPAPAVASIHRDVPPALAAIVDRCLAKNPANRYANADELLAAIDAALPQLERGQKRVSQTLISDDEAQAVWKRAAELQAATGLHPRPEPIARLRDSGADRSRASGFAVGEVRAAASEAGIADQYVEHALVEHGLVKGRGALPVKKKDESPSLRPSLWAGAPLYAAREIEIEGEIPARDLDGLLTTLRDATGRLGTTTARTRELGWSSGHAGNRFEVSVIPDQDRTTVHMTRNLRRNALALTIVPLLAVGFTVGPAVAGLLIELADAEEFGVMVGIAVGAFAGIKASRWLVRRMHRKVTEQMRVLGDALTAKIRDRIR